MTYDGPNRRRKRNAFMRALSEFGSDPPPSSRWHHIWRDFVPLAAILIAAYSVIGLESKVDEADVRARVAKAEAATAKQLASSQREGRRAAISITCGAVSAIIEAGRAAIGGGGDLPAEFERNLQQLGYPPRAQREKAARQAAERYSISISQAVQEESGVQGIVRDDGTLDCERVQDAARTAP